ncbi:MAG: Zn-dependent hydrolase [Magnetococcales bacterium]|nr:Zn-dependent hydrolase [Magnetococcales bacterium]
MHTAIVWLLLTLCPGELRTDSGDFAAQLGRYVVVPLDADLSGLAPWEKKMLPWLRDAALIMDALFWQQTYGERQALFSLPWSQEARTLLELNFGPWDRLEGNRPLLPGILPKPAGGNYYPQDLTREQLEAAVRERPELKHPYSLVRRDQEGGLLALPYHQVFSPWLNRAADLLRRGAQLSEDPALARYLNLRADGLVTDRYRESDTGWMAMKNNRLDLIIGPIETYDDGLLGVKAGYEALLLVKDREWEKRLDRYTRRLGFYQGSLPTPPEYRAEIPAEASDLGVYDVLLMTGDAAATRPIAINLPNDEQVQLEQGSRRLQLRNAMRAKFDRILRPMAEALLEPEQLPQVTFPAFFANTMFHEVAHGLGIKKTVGKPGTVTDALQEDAWMMEEGKADALSLLIGDLEPGEETGVSMESRYVTEFASLFRSIRFGPASSHARANLIRFNHLQAHGVFTRSPEGRYHVDPGRMRAASEQLAGMLLRLQGDGDLAGVRALEKRYGAMTADLMTDLRRVEGSGIPTDVVFRGVGID